MSPRTQSKEFRRIQLKAKSRKRGSRDKELPKDSTQSRPTVYIPGLQGWTCISKTADGIQKKLMNLATLAKSPSAMRAESGAST